MRKTMIVKIKSTSELKEVRWTDTKNGSLCVYGDHKDYSREEYIPIQYCRVKSIDKIVELLKLNIYNEPTPETDKILSKLEHKYWNSDIVHVHGAYFETFEVTEDEVFWPRFSLWLPKFCCDLTIVDIDSLPGNASKHNIPIDLEQVTERATIQYPSGVFPIEKTTELYKKYNVPIGAFDDIGYEWQSKRGTLIKRLRKWVKANLPSETLDRLCWGGIGDFIASNLDKNKQYIDFDVVDHINWEDGEFGKSGSCWWTCDDRSAAREVCPTLDCFRAIRFYNQFGRGVGRIWAIKQDDVWLLFNGYFNSGTKTNDDNATRTLSRYIAHATGLHYKRIFLEPPDEWGDKYFYINGSIGYALGKYDEVSDLSNVTLDLPDLADFRNDNRCGVCGYSSDDVEWLEYYGMYVCQECLREDYEWCIYHERYELKEDFNMIYISRQNGWVCGAEAHRYDYYVCYHCGEFVHTDDGVYDDDYFYCEDCWSDHASECEACGNSHWELIDGLCYDCKSKYVKCEYNLNWIPKEDAIKFGDDCYVNKLNFDDYIAEISQMDRTEYEIIESNYRRGAGITTDEVIKLNPSYIRYNKILI